MQVFFFSVSLLLLCQSCLQVSFSLSLYFPPSRCRFSFFLPLPLSLFPHFFVCTNFPFFIPCLALFSVFPSLSMQVFIFHSLSFPLFGFTGFQNILSPSSCVQGLLLPLQSWPEGARRHSESGSHLGMRTEIRKLGCPRISLRSETEAKRS